MAFYLTKSTKVKDNYSEMPSYIHKQQENISHTLSPTITGSSVIGLHYNGGVIIGSDTLCSYYSI